MTTITFQEIGTVQINHILAYAQKEKLKFEVSDCKFEIDQALEDLENGNLIHYGSVEEFSNRIDKHFV